MMKERVKNTVGEEFVLYPESGSYREIAQEGNVWMIVRILDSDFAGTRKRAQYNRKRREHLSKSQVTLVVRKTRTRLDEWAVRSRLAEEKKRPRVVPIRFWGGEDMDGEVEHIRQLNSVRTKTPLGLPSWLLNNEIWPYQFLPVKREKQQIVVEVS